MGKRGRGAPPLEIRFWEKVERTATCWNWIASANAKNGYGQIRDGGNNKLSHRLSYEWAKGPIPDGMFIDHVCHNRRCVNPDHLRIVTVKQNGENRRGASRSNKSSGVLGVTWFEPMHAWKVQVGHNGVKHIGGYFETIKEAAEAARELRNRLFTHNDADRRPA